MGVDHRIRPQSKAFNDTFTRKSKIVRQWVEGTVRLGHHARLRARPGSRRALGVVTDHPPALRLLAGVEVRREDEAAGPLQAFAGPNLPLQVSQMWLNQRVYQQYNSLVRNIRDENDPYVPDYWLVEDQVTMTDSRTRRRWRPAVPRPRPSTAPTCRSRCR